MTHHIFFRAPILLLVIISILLTSSCYAKSVLIMKYVDIEKVKDSNRKKYFLVNSFSNKPSRKSLELDDISRLYNKDSRGSDDSGDWYVGDITTYKK